jgi:hypothetical protein
MNSDRAGDHADPGPPTAALTNALTGGDPRSLGRAEDVANEVLAHPERFGELIGAVLHPDPMVGMRAADAAEKVTRQAPALLGPHKRLLLERIAPHPRPEIRWHAAQMLPRLDLTRDEREQVLAILAGYLADPSRIVAANAVSALADLARHAPDLRSQVAETIERQLESGSAAVRARARRELARLERPSSS